MKPKEDEQIPSYLQQLGKLHYSVENNGSIDDVIKCFQELISKDVNDVGSDENQNEYIQLESERNVLREVISCFIENILKNTDETSEKRKEKMSSLLQLLLSSMKTSKFGSSVIYENEAAKNLLDQVKTMLQSNVSREEKEHMRRSIIKFQYDAININESLNLLKDYFVSTFTEFSKEEILIEKLETGWNKNQRELTKRSQKMDQFKYLSTEKLSKIEKEIVKNQEENKDFRQTLNKTSDQITSLIEQLKTVNNESSFLNQQVEIIDTTITEMEKCKQKTESESAELEKLLEEKQSYLVEYLKLLDDELQQKVEKHRLFLINNEGYSNALNELTDCFATFEKQETVIMKKYNIEKPWCSLDHEKQSFYKENVNETNDQNILITEEIYSKMIQNYLPGTTKVIPDQTSPRTTRRKSIDLDKEERWKLVEKLQEDKVHLLKEKQTLERKVESLSTDLDDLYLLNQKLTNEMQYLKTQINGTSYIPGTCVIPTKHHGVTVRFPIIDEMDENMNVSFENLQESADVSKLSKPTMSTESQTNEPNIHDESNQSESNKQIDTNLKDVVMITKEIDDNVTKLNAKICELEDQNLNLESRIRTITEEKLLLKNICEELEIKLKQTQENISIINKEEKYSNEYSDENDQLNQIENLQNQVEDLQIRNEQLVNINKKAQSIFEENKELLDENTNLQDELESLEEQIQELSNQQSSEDKTKSNVGNDYTTQIIELNSVVKEKSEEINILKEELNSLDIKYNQIMENYKPRIIHLKSSSVDMLKLESSCYDTNAEGNQLEQTIIDERDRTVTLEKSNDRIKKAYSALQQFCKKIGLDTLKTGDIYNLIIKTSENMNILNSNGITITEKENNALNIFQNNETTLNESLIQESIVEELSSMLQQSYKDFECLKDKQKLIRHEMERLNMELNNKNEQKNDDKIDTDLTTNTDGNLLKTTLLHMGIAKLEYGVLYSVHFQAMSKSATTRRASRAYQHSCKPMQFDAIKRIIQDVTFNQKINSLPPSPDRKKITARMDSSNQIFNFSFENLVEELENKQEISHRKTKLESKNKEELERLLRMTVREKEELKRKNKSLEDKLKHSMSSKDEFLNEMNQNKEEDINDVNSKTHHKLDSKDSEYDAELDEAFKLSEANCIFLEKKYLEIEKKFRNAELQIDQEKLSTEEHKEQTECLKKELIEFNQKSKEYSKTVIDLKKDVDYLEKDVEYYKQIIVDNGIEIDEIMIHSSQINSNLMSDSLMLLKADLEATKNEKHQLLLTNESLNAKLKFSETEKKYLNSQLQESLQSRQHADVKIVTEPELKEKKNEKSEVNDIQQAGLAKRYKKLQNENKALQNQVDNLVVEKSTLNQKLQILQIEHETVSSTNQELSNKIINMEDNNDQTESKSGESKSGSLERRKKKNLASKVLQHWSNLLDKQNKNKTPGKSDHDYDAFKEETLLLAHENEEILESNNVLLQRNFELRKDKLNSISSLKQIELLKDRLSTIENENTILKLENMNSGNPKARRRKISKQFELNTSQLNIKTNIKQSSKETQTRYDFNGENTKDIDFIAEIDELTFIIEDLTKRNSELKNKIYDYEKLATKLESEREDMETLNEKLLSRNSDLKEQLEIKTTSQFESSAETNNPTLGLSFSFKDDILNDYEKVELEEENKNYKYENKMLKEESKEIKKINQEIMEELEKQAQKLEALENTKNELIIILRELKGVEFIESLMEDLNIVFDERIVDIIRQPKLNNWDDEASLNLEEPLQKQAGNSTTVDFNSNVDNEKILLENRNLSKQVENYQNIIEHLERQILHTDKSDRQRYSSNGGEEETKKGDSDEENSKILSEGTKNTTSENPNETIDELFQVKFLLESTNNVSSGEKTDENLEDNFSNNTEDSNEYQNCINIGELSSEMDDFFKTFHETGYTKDNNGNNDETLEDIDEMDCNNDEQNQPLLVSSDAERAVKISDLQRFQSKEHLQNAVFQLGNDIKEYENKNLELNQINKELRQNLFESKNKNDILNKEIELLNKNITHCVFNLDEQKCMNENINLEISTMKFKYKEMEETHEELNGILKEKEFNETKLLEENNLKILENEKLHQNITELEIIINDQDISIDNVNKKYAKNENELESLKENYNEKNNKNEELISEINVLNETLSIYKNKADENDSLINQLKNQLNEQNEFSIEITELNSTYENTIDQTKQAFQELEEKLQQVKTENEEMKEKHKVLEESAADLVEIIQEFEKKDQMLEELNENLIKEKSLNEQITEEIKSLKANKAEKDKYYKETIRRLSEKEDIQYENNETNKILQEQLKKIKLELAEKENLIQVLKERASSIIPFDIKSQGNQFQITENNDLKSQIDIKESEIGLLIEKLSEKENIIAMYEKQYEDEDVITNDEGDVKTRLSSSQDQEDMVIPEIRITKDSKEKTASLQRTYSFPVAATEHHLSLFDKRYRDMVLSDVSDDESFYDVIDYNEEYINKLKLKIKQLKEKVKGKNKKLSNLNVDLDNFLEDIRNKDLIIENLKHEVEKFNERITSQEENFTNDLDSSNRSDESSNTLQEISETQSSIATLQSSADIARNGEFVVLPENSYEDLKDLKNHVENLKKVSLHEDNALHDFLIHEINQAWNVINNIELKLVKHEKQNDNSMKIDNKVTKDDITFEKENNNLPCMNEKENLDINSEDSSEIPDNFSNEDRENQTPIPNFSEEILEDLDNRILHTPIILKSPGKTVQQIRHDNDKLVRFNDELKLSNQDLKQDIQDYNKLNENQSSEIQLLKDQIEQLDYTILKIKNEKDEDLIKAVDNKEKELRDLYFKNKEDELHETNQYEIDRNEIVMCKDPVILLERMERMNDRLKTAESQIEKDWVIIEGQGAQLENLHQQYIEQRDENHKHSQLLQDTDRELHIKEQKFAELVKILEEKCEEILNQREEINKIKTISKTKEDELESLLLEKEEGIEKLHSMISELEKSLNNSQKHIEGILNESQDNRERESGKNEIIKEQENIIAELKKNYSKLKDPNSSSNKVLDCSIKEQIINLTDQINGVKFKYQFLKNDFKNLSSHFSKEFSTILSQCSEWKQNKHNGENSENSRKHDNSIINHDSRPNDLPLVPFSKITNNKPQSPQTVQFSPELEYKIRNLQTIILNLQTELDNKDNLHQIQVDTLIQGLAKRSNIIPRSKGKILQPTIELSKASSRMGPSEFLQTCMKQLKEIKTDEKSGTEVTNHE